MRLGQRIAQAVRSAIVFAVLAGLPSAPPIADEGGPVYPNDTDVGGGAREAPWRATIASEAEPGERMVLTGTVFGHDDGKPRPGVTVYAYHTDAKGLYGRIGKGRPRLAGWTRTNAEGKYEFDTIKPAPYPQTRNPSHVHMTIAIPGKVEWWIAELRFSDDPLVDRKDVAREEAHGTFGSVRPLELQKDGTLRCVRDIRLPQGW